MRKYPSALRQLPDGEDLLRLMICVEMKFIFQNIYFGASVPLGDFRGEYP
jgi:hypothetical protein